ncbi:MAG TPA: aminopeptidase P family N-terminal domain-containing protein, partial [Nitrososphaerales archaeon]|nr:aminopeptidase P family N-terminal domain-containing protein [Nitrososphaerales archaeon]
MAPASTLSNLKRRAGRLAEALRAAGLEGAIIAPGPNLVYYTGVKAHLFERPFLLLVESDGDAHLLAPKLEAGPFGKSIPLTVHAWDDNHGPSGAFKELLLEVDTKGTWGCEGRVPFGFADHLLRGGLKA